MSVSTNKCDRDTATPASFGASGVISVAGGSSLWGPKAWRALFRFSQEESTTGDLESRGPQRLRHQHADPSPILKKER